MKRIISCLILLSVFLSFAPYAIAADSATSAESFAKGMGLIDAESYSRDKHITRAEFAGMLSRLCRLIDDDDDAKEWQTNNYSEASEETVNISARIFDDVDAAHPYYRQIMAVRQAGYMDGVGENLFAPEYNLVMGDAVAVFIRMLGYSEMAKTNSGIVSNLGLTSGISTPMDAPAKTGDILKLIYNALDINALEMNIKDGISYDKSKDTFMKSVLEMEKIKGVMTDNGVTSFIGTSKLGKDQVRVGDIIAKVSEKTEYVRGFIGHKVTMYYSTRGDEYEVVFIELAKDDESISFDISDFDSLKNNSISYYNGNRLIRKSLTNTVYMICNGEAKNVFGEDDFKFDSGEVTLVSTTGGSYDMIILTGYEFGVVGGVSVYSELIYNKIKNYDKPDLNEIDCSENGKYKNIIIKDMAGNELSLSDISQNDVLNILRNSQDITIIVSKTKVDGFTVKSISVDDGREVLKDGENEYTVSDAYMDYPEKVSFITGNTYSLYLNMFDRVVWAETFAGGDNIGILTKVFKGEEAEDEDLRFVKLYTSGGKLEKIDVAEKIRYNDRSKKFDDIAVELADYLGEAIMYTLDENGTITEIVTPESFGTFGDRGWCVIAPEGSYQYHANDKDLGQMFFYLPGTSTVFTVPKDDSEYNNEKAFSVNTFTFSDNGWESLTAYSKDKYSVMSDVIVIKTEGAGAGAVSALSDIFVIDKKLQGVNEEGDAIDIFKGWQIVRSAGTMTYTTLPISDECTMVDQKQGMEIDPEGDVKLTGPRTVAELEQGDIIRYDLNTNKEAYKIRTAYDASTGSYFHTGAGGFGSDLPLNPGGSNGSTGGSTWAGYALTKSGIGVRTTRGVSVLPSSIDTSDPDTVKKSLLCFKFSRPNAVLVVEKKGTKIDMYQGSIDDLRTYQDTKKDADTDILVMLTEWTTATRGTVIYKNFDFAE